MPKIVKRGMIVVFSTRGKLFLWILFRFAYAIRSI